MMCSHARKTSALAQLTDVMNRQIERSHPAILTYVAKIKPAISCRECGSQTHTVRSHNKQMNASVNEYDELVNDILIPA